MTSKSVAKKREEAYRKRRELSSSEVKARLLEGKSDLTSFAGLMAADDKFEHAIEDMARARRRTVIRNRLSSTLPSPSTSSAGGVAR
jgi:hypothetical protein